MKNLILCALATLVAATPVSTAFAQACSKQSPAHTVALLELYSSEGCDSCPPADHYVSALLKPGLSLDQVVPLALHVDYWDYIGWKDVFARPLFTERQRWLSGLANSRTIYTPEIFVAGQELRDWRSGSGVPAAIRRINGRPARAEIGISLGKPAGGMLPVDISAKAGQSGNLFVALYENGLVSEVKAGENRGVVLRHAHVVREWLGPIALSGGADGGKAALTKALSIPAGATGKNLGVAAFVQTERGDVLQALALPVCAG